MKLLCVALILPYFILGQVYDNFSDGDFTNNPTWIGLQNHFEIDSEYRLHLDAPSENASSHLCLSSDIIENASWEINVKLTFNPSGSNYLDWYLAANDSLLEMSSEAYFVRVGGSEDELALYRKQDGETTKIIDGLDDRVNVNPVDIRLKVERLIGGYWSLWVDLLDGNGWVLEGSVQDSEINASAYSGINCIYTSTRSDRFYFDEISINGMAYIDSVAPNIINTEVLNINQILIEFDAADLSEILPSQLLLVDSETSPNTVLKNGNALTLIFYEALPVNQTFQLKLFNISDSIGNQMNDTIIDLYIQQHQAFDIVINEIMIDPWPTVQLPNVAYIELYNRADYAIKLSNWMLKINDNEIDLDSIECDPNEYLVLIDEADSLEFEGHNFKLVSLPNINKTEGYIGLFDNNNEQVHEIQYHKNWYKNENKETGGWSLEMIDPENYCAGRNNWKACENTLGGSPGMLNSVHGENPDETAPYINEIVVVEDDEIQIHWSENIYDAALNDVSSYLFSHEINAMSTSHFMDLTSIQFSEPLESGVRYKMTLHNINDCQGNSMEQIDSEFVKGIWPEEGSIFINEILFNPQTEGHDYVELYNASNNFIDLSKLIIGNYDSLLNDIVNTKPVCETKEIFYPHSYMALCEDTAWIKSNYASHDSLYFLEINQLPSLPNEKGTVAISSLAYEMIDAISYNESMHFPLLEEVKGVALERLNTNNNALFSAASTENYGTPARKNSQFVYTQNSKGQLEVSPEIFSPNQDGNDDFVNITIEVERTVKASIRIYDKKGFVIREICHSELITHKANWIWDGLHESNYELPMGIYMVVAELIDEEGNQNIVKHPAVLSKQ